MATSISTKTADCENLVDLDALNLGILFHCSVHAHMPSDFELGQRCQITLTLALARNNRQAHRRCDSPLRSRILY